MSKFRDFRLKNKLTTTNDKSLFVDIGKNGNQTTKTLEPLLKRARQSGVLNLANRSLTEIPSDVYYINSPPKNETASVNFNETETGWWDDVFLNKLILTANLITDMSEDISNLDKLSYLDVSDNRIASLPTSINKLTQLKYFNISKNKIQELPNHVGNLQELQHLLGSYNCLRTLPPDASCLTNLTYLDLSHNELNEFPPQIIKLEFLTKVDLSYNQITAMPFKLDVLQKLQVLDLSQNKIATFCEAFRAPVQQLWLHVNRLTDFPIVTLHKNLKEISLTHNMIAKLTSDHLSNIPNICTLTMANNKISDIPEEISLLSSLSNLDISNNDIKTLPLSLGNMDELKCFSIDGNPFRLIKRSVINSGADSIKRYLRSRIAQDEEDNSLSPGLQALNRETIKDGSIYIDQSDLRATGILKLSSKGLTHISDDIFNSLENVPIKGCNFSGNKINIFPIKVFDYANSLYELDISNNQISDLPSSISCLRVLRRLDVSYNKIRKLPDSLSQIGSLTHLLLSYNDIGESIPNVIYGIGGLKTLIISHCGLATLDANKIKCMAELEVLDVSNNSISNIPPELGLCEKIKSLNLDGNCFKIPRAAVIAKGTPSVMEYLKSRIVTN